MKRLVSLAVMVFGLALAGCRTISLDSDAMMPERDQHLHVPQYFDVEWWTPLVKPGLLDYQQTETASPAIDPDTERVIVCTRDGMVRSLSPIDGRIEWEKVVKGRCFAGSTVSEGVAYVPGGDSVLYALRSRTGEELWKYEANEELVTAPVVAGDLVLVASQSETLFAVEKKTGKWKWQYRRDAPPGFTVRGTATPRVRDGVVYMGFADGFVVALTLADGQQKWERNLSTSGGLQFLDADASPVLDDAGNLFAASYKDGVYALKADSGELEWATARAGTSSIIQSGEVLLTGGDGKVAAFHSSSGRELWSLELQPGRKIEGTAGRPPLLLRGLLVVPTSHSLVFIDPLKGRAKVSWNPGQGVTATPTVYGGRLYVLSNLGTVFALQLRAGGS
ncbi:MAG: PQQ-binding-like beta-propeller repeat protein [Archangiaceae bacterium]|nr:PQQ-binding-like beta-propeller repeat protein [Archangiaceae bacterium]